ncbi:MAG: Asp-tRNA(Asn)/Glu-tRNA(Gln) amidotransferase subunit GatB [Gudongella sp.]|jgi:aspartyl-tRNA(Asn)/glutamyl-tRNA(Gln) amidotransferase subunit B|nr:Asp-tRNA(Asn)/Glu-tRNA(Gln) amidotransferase subunit GatB [Gudongella sp.]
MAYRTLIGLEIHVELMTKNKIFCNCKNEFGGEVNTHVCPVCMGLPGALPVLDKECLEFGIRAGVAFNSEIAKVVKMDRKNYFYSDLAKGYQISQDDMPLCDGGYLEIDMPAGTKRINLERIHIEEDTGKQIHNEDGTTLIDFNRSGVPLIEIVTKPDMTNAEEARLFLEKLRSTIKYIGISDVRMEEGSLRCDVNINIIDDERELKSVITEVKNLNSFRSVVKAIEFEEKRHIDLLEQGLNTERETRRWDEVAAETVVMRKKLAAEDYRLCYDGDLIPIQVDQRWLEDIIETMPELPHDKKIRFMDEYSLSEYDAAVLTQSKELAFFFEETMSFVKDGKLVANWMMGDVLRRLKEEEKEIEELKFTSRNLAELLLLVKDGKINNNTGKNVLREMFETGETPENIVNKRGLIQISDEGALGEIVDRVLDNNEKSIEDFKNGKDRAVGFLMGQIMKETKGKANPQLVNSMLLEKLNKR